MKLIVYEWGNKKQKILIKKNKTFHESKLLSLNIEKARKELNWEPRLNLEETISFTVEWYKSYFLSEKTGDLSSNQIEQYINK